jgi:hypothetical protein
MGPLSIPEMTLLQLDGCPRFANLPRLAVGAYLGRKRRGVPDFLYAALDTTACAAFIKESRMRFAEVTSCTGNPGLAP